MKITKGKVKFSKIEKFIFIMTFVLVVFSPIASIFAKASLSKATYEVEETKEEIAKEVKSNQSLQMKINELASLENLENIAKEMGLSYTNNSVKTIE